MFPAAVSHISCEPTAWKSARTNTLSANMPGISGRCTLCYRRQNLRSRHRNKHKISSSRSLLAMVTKFLRCHRISNASLGGRTRCTPRPPCSTVSVILIYFVSSASHAFKMISDASQDQEWDPAVLRDTVQWENVLGRIRMRALLGVSRGTELRPIDQLRRAAEPRSIIQLLYATRYCELVERRDRFYSLGALMPHDAPTARVSKFSIELCKEFCLYILTLSNNLDIFTLYSSGPSSYGSILPSWADFCHGSTFSEDPRPLLIQELITVFTVLCLTFHADRLPFPQGYAEVYPPMLRNVTRVQRRKA